MSPHHVSFALSVKSVLFNIIILPEKKMNTYYYTDVTSTWKQILRSFITWSYEIGPVTDHAASNIQENVHL